MRKQVGTCIHTRLHYHAFMVNRERIIEAAARVYARHGFRGATTRLIATEAGVNEVTLFRIFGSKAALLEAVLTQQQVGLSAVVPLPDVPSDPVGELSAFVQSHLEKLRVMRPLLVQAMSELDQRPEAADFACRGRTDGQEVLQRYATRLQAQGLADAAADVPTAVTMLSSSVMGDVMGRPMVPDAYPPIDEAAERYVRCFFRAIGLATTGAIPAAKPARASQTRTA
jgi:AcrR family transcriptional regulator